MMRNRPIGSVFFPVLTSALLAACLPIFGAPGPGARNASKHHRTVHSRYGVSTFADSTEGDIATFDDPIVRQAAIRGLGRYNGSVVAIDPNSGRILSIVKQKIAFSPCCILVS